MCARRRYRRESRACGASSGATPCSGRATYVSPRIGRWPRSACRSAATGPAEDPGRDPAPALRRDPAGLPRHRSARRRRGDTADNVDFIDAMNDLAADRVRVRARPELRPAHGGVPLGRRSPATAIVLNLLSVGRRLRARRARVPARHRERACSASSASHAIEAWVPLFLFSVLFGLSMDYQVFLLSRHPRALRRERATHARRSPTASRRPRG